MSVIMRYGSGGTSGGRSSEQGVTPVYFEDNTSSSAQTQVSKEYTVTGDGYVIVTGSIMSTNASDTGTTHARVYLNNVLVAGDGSRLTSSTDIYIGACASTPLSVSNGDTIKIIVYCTKNGSHTINRRFLCFGCTVAAAA